MYSATVTRDAQGVPTGLSGIAKENVLGGVVAGITQIIDENKVILPDTMFEKVLVEGTKIALGGVIDKRLVTGAWGIPFKA